MNLLLLGATGLVGSHVLQMALDNPQITSIVAPVRCELPTHPKLYAPVINFENINKEESYWAVDAVICALGTTIKQVGSKEKFKHVDINYPLQFAEIAYQKGARTYVLNSAIGANTSSLFFYNRVKGEIEQKLSEIGFLSLTFARPGLIGGHRPIKRFGESIMLRILTALKPIIPTRYQVNPAYNIAQKMLQAAIQANSGVHIIYPEEMIE